MTRNDALVTGLELERLAVQWAAISVTGSGVTVVPAVASKKIRVIAITFTVTADATVTFLSGSTALISGMPFAANGGMDLARNVGWFCETAAGEAFKMTASAGSVIGSLNYILVAA